MISSIRKAFKSAHNCAHCGRRFSNRGEKIRRRILKEKHEVLAFLNLFRWQNNDAPLTEESIVCVHCFERYNYASSQRNMGDSSDTASSQNENLDMGPASDDESSVDFGNACSQNDESVLHVESRGQRDPISPSETSCAARTCQCSNFAPISEDKCILCSLSFNEYERIVRRRLSTAKLLYTLLNGERCIRNEPKLRGESFICERCYLCNLRRFHSMWKDLPGVSCVQALPPIRDGEHPSQEEFSPMQTSQSSVTANARTASDEELDDETQDSSSSSSSDDSDDDSSRSSTASSSDSSESEDDLGSPVRKKSTTTDPRLSLPIKSLSVSGNYCCVCGKANVRHRAGKNSRMYIYHTMGIYIPAENRICRDHRDSNHASGLNPLSFIQICNQQVYQEYSLTPDQITEIIEYLRGKVKWYEGNYGRMSFGEGQFYTNADYMTLFGVTQENFNYLHSICKPHMRNSAARSTEDGLAMFLMKLRLNPSYRTLACLFGTSAKVVSICIGKVRKVLHVNFAKHWLGFAHISRETYINDKTSLTAKTITAANDNQAICVVDGTYLYIQKSTNYELQRRTYSLHKYRNLLKAMMVVSTRGYILAVEGPYFGDGSNNDSNIMKNLMKDKDGFRSFFLPGDFIIEDRGFRDCNTLLSNLGYSVRMPHFLGKRRQHPTSEANESRLVTKIRWIVESVNGRIKNVFRFFRDVIPNNYMRKNRGFEILEIACAMLNAFHPLIFNDDEGQKMLAERMLARSELSNLLQEHLENESYVRMTGQWKRIGEDCLLDFPKLKMEQLRELTFGVYQIKEARSYMADTMDEFGRYEIFFHDDLQKNAVRFKVQSRHHTSTQYDIWIGYNILEKGANSITGWYCKCPNGSRVLGCCAHIAAIIWYLSYARYLSVVLPPGANLAGSIKDARTFSFENEFIDDLSDEEVTEPEPVAGSSHGGQRQYHDEFMNDSSSDDEQ